MRKYTSVKKSSSSTLMYTCPHCEGLSVVHKNNIMNSGNEVGRENLTDTLAYITYNFDCKLCEKELQTGIEINSNNQIINS